jgi:hypothetical protein
VDTSPRRDTDAKNRRSTRIVQAVPLTVTGVDALGRPFQERTSTLIINCQGCRYQSKHYVLKNMWLTFEVPHPETGQPPRSVRARVTWVQRPRTVRELFQIGAELETAGNLWGVAFPPSDWAPFPDGSAPEISNRPAPAIPAPSAPAEESAPLVEIQTAAPPAATEPEIPAPQEEPAAPISDNVRMMPSPAAADESLQLARQMGRLVNEARQHLQEAVHAQASQAVSVEIRSLLVSVDVQLREAAEKAVREVVSTRGEEVLRSVVENISQGEIERLSARWAAEADRHLRGGIGRLSAEIDAVESRRRQEVGESVNARFDEARAEVEAATRALEAETAAAHARLDQWRRDAEEASAAALRRWTETAESSSEQARARIAELESAASRAAEHIAAASAEAESAWRNRVESDVATVHTRFDERIESSLDVAARQAAERMAQTSENSAHDLERRVVQRIEAIGQTFTEASAEAERALEALRGALAAEAARADAAIAQLHEATARIEGHGAALDAARQSASDELERRGQAIVESREADLNRRAEAIANSVVERLEPALNAAGHRLLAALALQIEQQIAPHVQRAGAALRDLEAGSARAEAAARAHAQRLQEDSERSLKDATARAEEIFRQIESRFQESGGAVQARWLAELDAKATETTHNAFEAIFKSADWYEKKVQTQMQSTLERGLAQAAETLRAKAGEVSGVFASELDHFTRSYVEHAKGQLDEQARAAAARTQEAAQQASDAVAAGFSDRAAKIAGDQYQRLVTQSSAAQEHFSARLHSQAAEAQEKLDEAARQTAAHFRVEIEEQSDESLRVARQKLDAHSAALTEAWRATQAAEIERDVQKVQSELARLGNQAVDDYKLRLENNSNTWLLASVTKLNQNSQNLIEQLAAASAERIRAACAGVFAGIGESLRHMAAAPAEPNAAPSDDPSPKPDAPASNS